MFTTLSAGRAMPHLSFAQTPRAFYLVVLNFLAVASLIVIALSRSRMGRLLRGFAESPTAMSTMGLSINLAKFLAFCISAYRIAGRRPLRRGSFPTNGGDTFFGSFNSPIFSSGLGCAGVIQTEE
jgi:hypothetical protein